VGPTARPAKAEPAGPAGSAGKEGPQGKEGAQGKEGPKGPGASQLTFKLPASASPSFTNVGTIEGISLEAKCVEDVANKVVLEMMYTAPAQAADANSQSA
jgi:hypothetical protein